ncbi:hypothetical protein OG21DRAFT_1489070 [Imleria badia]|nr:hypothetical protein OG21DRAFT_1489070 [Imleria badia]
MSTSAGPVASSPDLLRHHPSEIANEQALAEKAKILTDGDVAPSAKNTKFWQGWWMGASGMVSEQALEAEAETSDSN